MSLRDFLDDATARQRTLTVFAPERFERLESHFETRTVAVDHVSIPDDGSGGFVVVTDRGEFVGSVGAAAVRDLLGESPRRSRTGSVPGDPSTESLGPSDATRALLGLLADTTFVSFDRRRMLAVTREIEDRAYRLGAGTLRTGFQRGSALAAQRELYESLAAESLLDVHVYLRPDWTSDAPASEGLALHAVDSDEIGEFWFVVFDGGGDPEQACALVAAERGDSGEFDGFWTYDPETVAEIDAYLERTYG
ncbi:sensor protein [Halorussus salilacus]|uniref:DICT sensory domain-containing protein n=1 Tax=Halorussus salilacus TaxID=2953750 RepID=UPI0020A193FF|nr:DICT sensory domain-containing protein [Halorussus salilacus]USZ67770.1 sensor protein [Halorussus salilacus]